MPIATKNDKINLSSEKKTKDLAYKLLTKLKSQDVVFLNGEMGIGKTTLIRYFINGLQKKNRLKITEVTSPTFNLMNEYNIKDIKINHYDLFRIKTPEEINDLNMFKDNLNTITFVEWPQIIKKRPKNLIELNFKYEENYQKRFVQIKGISL
tara:strand:+ start:437 stop:892 length:456 start_codon:yes stop_codon:yes gene_type:complete